ncbi:DUF1467 domain-containing protein [Halovivax gelatinilyticus]|uniref:DUF1467 domain-containing protein n=1 Tax=Halovivax gelatinilyticus TaxID=2961597 RepID=UPI0020CA2EC8|nr:DUF1467 domain-containing protein [Halovivax gelatinilyticus]
MKRTLFPGPFLIGSIAITAAGVSVADGGALSIRTVPALVLISIGVAGIARLGADRSVDQLERSVTWWWTGAFAAFVPYALVMAPSSETAAAVGGIFGGSVTTAALEAVAGALVLCAVSMSVLYVFARYGIHPGSPTPEERVLND